MSGQSMYFNYYNIEGRYTPKAPEIPTWRKSYEVVDDKIQSHNCNPKDDHYKALDTLEKTYYSVSVQNRIKYSTVSELHTAIRQKYFLSGDYDHYTEGQKKAMYDNEISMTLFGIPSGDGFKDPHLTDKVYFPTESEKKSYNRHMVNLQISNLLKSGGIDMQMLEKYNMEFMIDPFTFKLKVLGVDDMELASAVEKILNTDRNSEELFYHIYQSRSSGIKNDIMLKYRALREFKAVTDQDIREYKQTKSGLVNEKGEKVLDVYQKALKECNKIPGRFKANAYSVFAESIKQLMLTDFAAIPDMNLSIGYKNEMLVDLKREDIMISQFDVMM